MQSPTGCSCGNAPFYSGSADGRALPARAPFPVCPVLLLRATMPQTCRFDNLVSSPTWTSSSVTLGRRAVSADASGARSHARPRLLLPASCLLPRCCRVAFAHVLCSPAGIAPLAMTKPELLPCRCFYRRQ